MNVTLITVGKLKESYLSKAVEEYQKRLSRYCRLNIIEVADEKTPDHSSLAQDDIIRKKEADRIMRLIKDDAYVITLEIAGNQLDSIKFAKLIEDTGIAGTSHIMFIIGGSLGLNDSVTNRADFSLSFSEMTFPHQLMRVILLEQIYRAYRIINHEPYHK